MCASVMMVDCWLLTVQWQIFHVYSEREQVQQYNKNTLNWRKSWRTGATTFDFYRKKNSKLGRDNSLSLFV